MTRDTEANCVRGNLMYNLYAALFQRPRVWMSESSSPLWAAVVAAPIRKLCPLYLECCTPTSRNAACRRETNIDLVSGSPLVAIKRGPWPELRTLMYSISALTGHTSDPVDPRKTSTPKRKGSVLLCLMRSRTNEGHSWLSMATSARLR